MNKLYLNLQNKSIHCNHYFKSIFKYNKIYAYFAIDNENSHKF